MSPPLPSSHTTAAASPPVAVAAIVVVVVAIVAVVVLVRRPVLVAGAWAVVVSAHSSPLLGLSTVEPRLPSRCDGRVSRRWRCRGTLGAVKVSKKSNETKRKRKNIPREAVREAAAARLAIPVWVQKVDMSVRRNMKDKKNLLSVENRTTARRDGGRWVAVRNAKARATSERWWWTGTMSYPVVVLAFRSRWKGGRGKGRGREGRTRKLVESVRIRTHVEVARELSHATN